MLLDNENELGEPRCEFCLKSLTKDELCEIFGTEIIN